MSGDCGEARGSEGEGFGGSVYEVGVGGSLDTIKEKGLKVEGYFYPVRGKDFFKVGISCDYNYFDLEDVDHTETYEDGDYLLIVGMKE